MVVIGLLGLAGCTSGLAQRFQDHVNYLACDELAGRGVGSPGIELAAEYIASQFAGVGLEPAGDDGTYFQTFPLAVRRSLTDAARLSFTGEPVENRRGRDFIPFHFSSNEEFTGPVIFCGYG
ncbi:MAG: hypothetical protein IIC01_10835, partial [Planctomycetes bacterium]|nr:hypothetical protein [Planctomycetota bacterium]